MNPVNISNNEDIHFRLRFNTKHAGTNLFWRVFIGEQEYLASEIKCMVPTVSDASFDEQAGEMKYNIAGVCREFIIDADGLALFR